MDFGRADAESLRVIQPAGDIVDRAQRPVEAKSGVVGEPVGGKRAAAGAGGTRRVIRGYASGERLTCLLSLLESRHLGILSKTWPRRPDRGRHGPRRSRARVPGASDELYEQGVPQYVGFSLGSLGSVLHAQLLEPLTHSKAPSQSASWLHWSPGSRQTPSL